MTKNVTIIKPIRFSKYVFISFSSLSICLSRTNRVKSAKIRRFEAGSDLSLYPIRLLFVGNAVGVFFYVFFPLRITVPIGHISDAAKLVEGIVDVAALHHLLGV